MDKKGEGMERARKTWERKARERKGREPGGDANKIRFRYQLTTNEMRNRCE